MTTEQTNLDSLLLDQPIRINHFGVDVAEVQRQQRVWAERNFGDKFNAESQILGIIEEVSELAAAWLINWHGSMERFEILSNAVAIGADAHRLLKAYQGIRENGATTATLDPSQKPELIRDAIGDIQLYLIGLSTKQELSHDRDVIARTWAEVRQRDWVKFPNNGRTA